MSSTTVPSALADAGTAVLRTFGAQPFHTDGDLLALAFGDDGALWSIEEPGVLRRWNVAEQQQAGWQMLDELATQWCFSPGARFVAAGSDDVSVWDSASGELIEMWQNSSWVTAMAFAPQGSLLGTGHDDKVVRVWDCQGQDCLHELHGHQTPISAIAFSADGQRLASAGEDRLIHLWDLKTGKRSGTLKGHTDRIPALAWHPDGKRLISAGWDTTARVWDVETCEPIILLNSHANQVQTLDLSRDGSLLASADSANTVHVWDLSQNKEIAVLPEQGGEVRALAFAPDGGRIAAGGADRVIHVWDARGNGANGEQIDPLVSRTGLAVSPDGKRLASLGAGTNLRIWDVATGQAAPTPADTDKLGAFAASPDGKWFALSRAGNDAAQPGRDFWQQFGGARFEVDLTTLGVWDAATGERRALLDGQKGPITALAFSPDSGVLASASFQSSDVWLWKVPSGEPLLLIPNAAEGCSVEAVAFQPNGNLLAVAAIDWLATGGGDGHTVLWDLEQRRPVHTIKGGASSVAFHPAGRRLAVASLKQIVRIWSIEGGRPPLELIGHSDAVTCVAYSPDGRWLVSGSDDHTVRLWDAEKGLERGVLELDTQVKAITFSPDGRSVFTGNANTSCYQLDLQPFFG